MALIFYSVKNAQLRYSLIAVIKAFFKLKYYFYFINYYICITKYIYIRSLAKVVIASSSGLPVRRLS